MRVTFAYLVLVDISGYTRFVTAKHLALQHAEQIITDLIDAVLDRTRYPLVLNKLEGDAALLYREAEPDDRNVAQDILAQVGSFFPAFCRRADELRAIRANCNCEACSNIAALKLKAFVHAGEIAIKQVRQFNELAGPALILIHRLLKNSVLGHEYVLMTQDVVRLGHLPHERLTEHHEMVDGIGELAIWLADPHDLPNLSLAPSGKAAPWPPRINVFHHLPVADQRLRTHLWRCLPRWLQGRLRSKS